SKGASAETWVYSYDTANHLTSAKQQATDGGTLQMQATYAYDAFDNRLQKDVWTQAAGTTTTKFGYDGPDVWTDLDASNNLKTRYLHGDAVDELFARVGSTGTAAWYLQDWQGSVRNIVDANGTLQDTITYDG